MKRHTVPMKKPGNMTILLARFRRGAKSGRSSSGGTEDGVHLLKPCVPFGEEVLSGRVRRYVPSIMGLYVLPPSNEFSSRNVYVLSPSKLQMSPRPGA